MIITKKGQVRIECESTPELMSDFVFVCKTVKETLEENESKKFADIMYKRALELAEMTDEQVKEENRALEETIAAVLGEGGE